MAGPGKLRKYHAEGLVFFLSCMMATVVELVQVLDANFS